MKALPPAIEQAIDWHARRSSGQFDETDQLHFQHWLEADPNHRTAWESLQQCLQRTLPPLGKPAVRRAVQAPRIERRVFLRGALALGGMAAGVHLLGRPGMPLASWNADLKTDTAQRRLFTLADGSELQLNAETAVDLDFSATKRSVTLLRGSLVARIQPREPLFSLICRHGETQLSAGRCLLDQQTDRTLLWILDGEATLFSVAGEQTRLEAGLGAEFDTASVRILPPPSADPTAWTRGLLEVNDQPLARVIDSLRPYHPGVLQVADSAAELRISGVFTLDDSEKALQALAEILPLRIERYLGFWTRIERA
ncbi:DUF4880 domain-containing protein [Azotobacter vinelandii]